MPNTKLESLLFTAITAWIIVYIMTLYNQVLVSGSFNNETFSSALQGMWVEYILIFLCAFFLSSRIAKYFAFRIVQPGDRPIVIIVTIQIFTVLSQVALASILGLYHFHGFNSQILPNYIMIYCKNFIVALPVQFFLAGPITRTLFHLLFRRTEKKPQKSIKQVLSNTLQ